MLVRLDGDFCETKLVKDASRRGLPLERPGKHLFQSEVAEREGEEATGARCDIPLIPVGLADPEADLARLVGDV